MACFNRRDNDGRFQADNQKLDSHEKDASCFGLVLGHCQHGGARHRACPRAAQVFLRGDREGKRLERGAEDSAGLRAGPHVQRVGRLEKRPEARGRARTGDKIQVHGGRGQLHVEQGMDVRAGLRLGVRQLLHQPLDILQGGRHARGSPPRLAHQGRGEGISGN